MDSSIKGLDCGADAYVGKPFDPFYLKAVINNLLENRKRMQMGLCEKPHLGKPTEGRGARSDT